MTCVNVSARVPELPDMVADRGDSLIFLLVREELANLVGHVDESVMRHGESVRS